MSLKMQLSRNLLASSRRLRDVLLIFSQFSLHLPAAPPSSLGANQFLLCLGSISMYLSEIALFFLVGRDNKRRRTARCK